MKNVPGSDRGHAWRPLGSTRRWRSWRTDRSGGGPPAEARRLWMISEDPPSAWRPTRPSPTASPPSSGCDTPGRRWTPSANAAGAGGGPSDRRRHRARSPRPRGGRAPRRDPSVDRARAPCRPPPVRPAQRPRDHGARDGRAAGARSPRVRELRRRRSRCPGRRGANRGHRPDRAGPTSSTKLEVAETQLARLSVGADALLAPPLPRRRQSGAAPEPVRPESRTTAARKEVFGKTSGWAPRRSPGAGQPPSATGPSAPPDGQPH